jgi:hypothetical protein
VWDKRRKSSNEYAGNDLPREAGFRGAFECVGDCVAMGIIGLMIVVSTLRVLGLIW